MPKRLLSLLLLLILLFSSIAPYSTAQEALDIGPQDPGPSPVTFAANTLHLALSTGSPHPLVDDRVEQVDAPNTKIAAALASATQVTTGQWHTCALTVAGGVKCWGANASGQLGNGTTTDQYAPVDVSGLDSGVTAVSAGRLHTCALTAGGGVKCWGNNYDGQLGDSTTTTRHAPVDVSGLTSGVTAVAAGYHHTCALTAGGGVKCWGDNYNYQLGDGTRTDRHAPVDVSGLTGGMTAVSGGVAHTCALTAAGGVKCWGDNRQGQLGNGGAVHNTPVDVSGLSSGVTAVSGGGAHTCALSTAGGVQCWGDNTYGQLGDGTTDDRYKPVNVTGLSSGMTAVSGGGAHTCALTAAGAVKCWGANTYGQLGDGTTDDRYTSADVSGLSSGMKTVTAGANHACAMMDAAHGGGIKCWGQNNFGQLGNGATDDRSTPVDVDGPAGGVSAVTAGRYHTCALTTGGGVKCWGNNDASQLGDGATTDRYTPADVSGLSNGLTTVVAGEGHTCALTTSGGVKCWGYNSHGQLGVGNSGYYDTPVDVSGLSSGVKAVAGGTAHTCALTTAGGVKCWGFNGDGRLGDGTFINRYTPVDVSGLTGGVDAIAADGSHTCAVLSTGAIKCWGRNNYGQLGDGTTVDRKTPVDVSGLSSGVKDVATGVSHTCALTTGGGVKCWGDNRQGQLGDGATISRYAPVDVWGLSTGVTTVTGGESYTCALTTDGGVKCWGYNASGRLGDGTMTDRSKPVSVSGLESGAVAVAAGWYHTCAVTTGGGVKCWGDNTYGQLGINPGWLPVDVLGFGGGLTYTISGRVTDGAGRGIAAVTISAGMAGSAVTDANGNYLISNVIVGAYTLIPNKPGYTFNPAFHFVWVPPDATEQNFTATSDSGLIYVGPPSLPSGTVMISETDNRITMGDHVHLRLPFRNNSAQTLHDVEVEFLGGQGTGNSPGVSIYNGTDWHNIQQVALTPADISPGGTGYADFWIYISDNDPDFRDSLHGQTSIRADTDSGQWVIGIALSPITFNVSGHEDLKSASCLHTPGDFGIQKYANYAASSWSMFTPPTNAHDADTVEMAIQNLVHKVRDEFDPADRQWPYYRMPDTVLLGTRGADIGVCRHYADLTTGLIRSLGVPGRYTSGYLKKPGWLSESVGHAWVEVYTGGSLWRNADSTWRTAFYEGVYEARGNTVTGAWADLYPLAAGAYDHCVTPCSETPINCSDCLAGIANWPYWPVGCTKDVLSRYHNTGLALAEADAGTVGNVKIDIHAPIFVTRGLPFAADALLTNTSTQAINVLTATLSLQDTISSTLTLYDIMPAYHAVTDLEPGAGLTVTWTVTPQVAGTNLPLRIAALSEDVFGISESMLVVGEPGAPPPLTVGGTCTTGDVSPGQSVTLSAYLLDQTLQPLICPEPGITATVSASPTTEFPTTVPLTYEPSSGQYEGVLNLPADAPAGRYDVHFQADCPGYSPAESWSAVWAAPPLDVTMYLNTDTVRPQETLIITVHVKDRGKPISTAGVWADIVTADGTVRVPLLSSGGADYVMAFQPVDFASSFSNQMVGGIWTIEARADFRGGTGSTVGTILVQRQVYLPLVLRDH